MQALEPHVTLLATDHLPATDAALLELQAALEDASRLLDGAGLDDWVGDAMVLTDDHAPVDQLLTPHATAG